MGDDGYSLDLVKNRVGVMNPEMRKSFIGTILVGLIEKSSDAKVCASNGHPVVSHLFHLFAWCHGLWHVLFVGVQETLESYLLFIISIIAVIHVYYDL